MGDHVLLNEINIDQVDRLLVKHGKRAFGPLSVKSAWLPIILTNSLRASCGEIVPINVQTLTIEQLNQINPPRWLIKLRKGRVHEEDIEKLLRLGINNIDQLKGLTDSFMRDAGIGLEARRSINRIIKSPNTSDLHCNIIDLPHSSLPEPSGESDSMESNYSDASERGEGDNTNQVRPVSTEIVENVIRFMTNQMEIQDPTVMANSHRYVRSVVSLLLQIVAGRVPIVRLMQVAGSIWDLLNQSNTTRR